ncbi:GAF domain-containing protein [Muricoccus radiodurans]|uniref:GAF domain-containing protein n=1 Tax=Muricoccus radiodurans TaxID=2231721 RepID=UPI003CF2C0FB
MTNNFPHADVGLRREAALAAYQVMDTPPEPEFDDLVHEAARLCNAPISAVSLMDSRRQWFKARAGVEIRETPIEQSFCALTPQDCELLVVPDLTRDPRTANNPLVVGAPYIRFYAGAPLRLPDGLQIGSLCVVDTVPRPHGLHPWQREQLTRMARGVEALLDARRPPKASEAPDRAPRREWPRDVCERNLQELLDHAQSRRLHGAEELLRLTIEALTARDDP